MVWMPNNENITNTWVFYSGSINCPWIVNLNLASKHRMETENNEFAITGPMARITVSPENGWLDISTVAHEGMEAGYTHLVA
jgi:hypothetical protein